MERVPTWQLGKRVVHLVDREADSLGHYHRWQAAGNLFLVRVDDRRVLWSDQPYLISQIVSQCQQSGGFREIRKVLYRGKEAWQRVAEVEVVLHKPHRMRIQGRQREIPGPPLALRLVISQVLDERGQVLATWILLTNVPAELADTGQIALWYYWRWRIESFYKLLKSHMGRKSKLGNRRAEKQSPAGCWWRLWRAWWFGRLSAKPVHRQRDQKSAGALERTTNETQGNSDRPRVAGRILRVAIDHGTAASTNFHLEDLKSFAAQSLPFLNPSGEDV